MTNKTGETEPKIQRAMVKVVLTPGKVGLCFLCMVVFLTLIHCIVQVLFFNLDHPDIFFYVRWFDLDIEKNVPSTYSAFALFVCSLLFFLIAANQKSRMDYRRWCWFGLSVLFLFLSIDEWFEIHEIIGDMTENYLKAEGLLYFPWVAPYGLAVTVLGLIYLKFILGLPRRTAALVVLAGIIFLTGAIAFDMLGGREAELHGYDTLMYCVLYTIEEFLEMIAIVLLIYTLLSYIERQFGVICVTFRIRKT